MMTSDPRIKTVLLAGGTRNVDLVDPANPDTRFLLAASASGGAMVLRRDYPQNRLLGTAFSVDPDIADEVYVPGGGTEIPFGPENLQSGIMYFNTSRPAVGDRVSSKALGAGFERGGSNRSGRQNP